MRLAPFLALFVLPGFLLALASCDDAQDPPMAYSPPTTQGGLVCVAQCGKARNYCGWSCDLDYRYCYDDMQKGASRDYENYASYRLAHKVPVDLQPEDFEHPEKCEIVKKHCMADCDRPYNACYGSCGGDVAPRDDD
jgi:hypothetical protein